jgi:hypothetical protein
MDKKTISKVFFYHFPNAISVVLHPLVMPSLGLLILFNSIVPLALMSDKGKQIIISLVIICTLVLPLTIFSFLYFRKFPDKLLLTEKKDRILPLIFTSVLYYLAFYLLRQMGAPYIVQIFLFSASFSVFITLLISFFWKISAHTIGIGGVCALVVVLLIVYRIDVMLYLMITILLSGIIGFARLSLNEHTPSQIYFGFIVGFMVTIISFALL